MFSIIRHWLGHTREPRSEYFNVVGECGILLRDLRMTVRPIMRARYFGYLALGYLAAAKLHPLAWGEQMIGEDGRSVSAGFEARGRLYEALMEVEHAVAYGHDRRPVNPIIEEPAGRVLDEIVRVGGMTNRLRAQLTACLGPAIGEYTARESIAALPFPGTDYDYDFE